MDVLRKPLLAILLAVTFSSCSNAAEKNVTQQVSIGKGVPKAMKTYYIGRFAIDVPEEFKLEMQALKLRYADLSDFKWNPGDRGKERELLWSQKMSEIKNLPKPVDKNKIAIEKVNLPSIGHWANGILYYGDYLNSRRLFYTILIDYGEYGLWLTIAGTNKDKMVKNIINIVTHYDYESVFVKKESFHMKFGEITLPYMEQEKSYARIAGPMEMILRVEMEETHQVEMAGVMDRLAASLAVNFAPGVDVDKVRVGQRTAAGLTGQEVVTRLSDKNGKELFFAWDYQGRENSGEHPEIKIGVECPDGRLEEKLNTWDKLLNSFRAVAN